jgi:SAM-dependent methyltransferase
VATVEGARRKYDALADSYEDIFFYVADAGQRLIDFADPAPGTRVLDVGTGRGAVARAALARGCVVTAVDASPRMVERLTADFPEITGREMDAHHLDFAGSSFDFVVAGFVVQVLHDKALALAEFRRVLAPAGMIALSLERQTIGRLRWLHDLRTEFFAAPAEDTSATRPAGPMTEQQLDHLLVEAGFVDLTRKSVDLPAPMSDPSAFWEWLARQGLQDAVRTLPGNRRAEFRSRFFAEAERMHNNGGIVLDFGATLHRAHAPG